jgi:SNF2 family DNA or RNA helicase
MSLDDELVTIEEQIKQIAENEKARQIAEFELKAQISALRIKLAQITDQRFADKQKSAKLTKDRESVVRQIDLERETRILNAQTEERRKEVEHLLKSAPWYHDAFDWQIDGAIRLPERALLGDRRGLGKTLSSIIWRRVHKVKRTLICLRKEVAYDFIKELSLREPNVFVYSLLGATPQERQTAAFLLSGQEEFIVVTNIESWRRSVKTVTSDLLKIGFDGVILDEAHHIKSHDKATAQGFFVLADVIPKVLELTGTPIKNRPQEMFSLLHALYPGLFPDQKKYLYDHCILVGPNRWAFSERGIVKLVEKIDAFYLARGPEDVGRKVPPPRVITYELDFENHPAQLQAYKDMTERSMAVFNSGTVVPIVSQLAIMTRQAQTVSWPAGIEFEYSDEHGVIRRAKFDVHESVKADWAEELITELIEEGERVVLFSRFKPVITELRRRFVNRGLSVAVITGDEKFNTKDIFDDFDLKTAPENPKYQVLLATYQTVGESANFNAATHMVLFDRFWNPGNEDQAIGRVDRINSVTQATIHIPEVKNTIDEYMRELIEEKKNMIGQFKTAAEQQNSLREHLEKSLA